MRISSSTALADVSIHPEIVELVKVKKELSPVMLEYPYGRATDRRINGEDIEYFVLDKRTESYVWKKLATLLEVRQGVMTVIRYEANAQREAAMKLALVEEDKMKNTRQKTLCEHYNVPFLAFTHRGDMVFGQDSADAFWRARVLRGVLGCYILSRYPQEEIVVHKVRTSESLRDVMDAANAKQKEQGLTERIMGFIGQLAHVYKDTHLWFSKFGLLPLLLIIALALFGFAALRSLLMS